MKPATKKKVEAPKAEPKKTIPGELIAWQAKWRASIPVEADKELRELMGLPPL